MTSQENIIRFDARVEQLDYLNYWFIALTPTILALLPGRQEKGDFNQRLIVTLDDTLTWNCGVLALGEGSGLITVQQSRLKKLGKTLGDSVSVTLIKDTSEFGVPVPEEISEYWNQVPESLERFSKLTAGMQRYILNHIATAKTSDKRLERTHTCMFNLLQLTPGKETFRAILGKPAL